MIDKCIMVEKNILYYNTLLTKKQLCEVMEIKKKTIPYKEILQLN